jgi:hypothetical protein
MKSSSVSVSAETARTGGALLRRGVEFGAFGRSSASIILNQSHQETGSSPLRPLASTIRLRLGDTIVPARRNCLQRAFVLGDRVNDGELWIDRRIEELAQIFSIQDRVHFR